MNQGFHFVRLHASGLIFGESRFLLLSNEISTFLIFRLIRAPCLSGCMLWVRFSESRVFCIGLMKYQQFWFFDGFVRCIGRPFDQHFWAVLNHKQNENVEIAQGFSYFLNTRSNHSEWMLLPIGHSWAFRNHRQIENFQNYTRFFIFFLNRIEWILRTWENFQALWKHDKLKNVNISLDQWKKNILKKVAHDQPAAQLARLLWEARAERRRTAGRAVTGGVWMAGLDALLRIYFFICAQMRLNAPNLP